MISLDLSFLIFKTKESYSMTQMVFCPKYTTDLKWSQTTDLNKLMRWTTFPVLVP